MLLEVKRRDPASVVSQVASNLVRIVHIRIVAEEEKRLSARSKPISPTLGGVAVGGVARVLPGAGGGECVSAGGPWQLGSELPLPRQAGSSSSGSGASAFGGPLGSLKVSLCLPLHFTRILLTV